MAVSVRPGRIEDLPALTDIYNHYVVNTHITFDLEPFTVEQRAEWFSHYGETGRHRLLVALDDTEVVGYATGGRFRDKPAYGPSVETTTNGGTSCGSNAIYRSAFVSLQQPITAASTRRGRLRAERACGGAGLAPAPRS